MPDPPQGALPDLFEAGRTELEGLPLLRDHPDRTEAFFPQRQQWLETSEGRIFQPFLVPVGPIRRRRRSSAPFKQEHCRVFERIFFLERPLFFRQQPFILG